MRRAILLGILVVAVSATWLAVRHATRSVTLSGTLFVPPEWGDIDASLELRAAEAGKAGDLGDFVRHIHRSRSIPGHEMQEDPQRQGCYHWSISDVDPGSYVLRSVEFTFAQLVEVGKQGQAEVEMVIGPKAEVVIEVLSLDTDDLSLPKPIALEWNCVPPPAEQQVIKPKLAQWDATDYVYRFSAPAGKVDISVGDVEPEVVGESTVALRPGRNKFTIRVRKRGK